jgi:hypothetical protein
VEAQVAYDCRKLLAQTSPPKTKPNTRQPPNRQVCQPAAPIQSTSRTPTLMQAATNHHWWHRPRNSRPPQIDFKKPTRRVPETNQTVRSVQPAAALGTTDASELPVPRQACCSAHSGLLHLTPTFVRTIEMSLSNLLQTRPTNMLCHMLDMKLMQPACSGVTCTTTFKP